VAGEKLKVKRINKLQTSPLKIPGRLLIVLVIFLASMGAQMIPVFVSAAGQVSTRSITMSTSATSIASSYKVTFTPVTSATVLVLDFCSNDPLYNDTCSFSAATVPTVASPVSSAGTATALGSGSPVHTIQVTGLTMTAGTAYTITISSGITNPTGLGTFYGRILTYSTAGQYTPANTTGATPTINTPIDYGGIALSTTSNITITSKVFETLAFCVYQTACGTAPNLVLGNSLTGALSVGGAYVNSNTSWSLATNAGSGVNVTMTGTSLCTPGGTCATGATNPYTITAIGATPTISNVGTEQFGMCVNKNGSTALTIAAAYTDSINNCTGITTGTYTGTSKFGFDDNATTGTTSAGGSQVFSSTSDVPSVVGSLSFLGNISSVTSAGVYTTNLNMVATGTF
jgi:hypothetical protein